MAEDDSEAPGSLTSVGILLNLSLISVLLRLFGFRRVYLALGSNAERAAARRTPTEPNASGDGELAAARGYAALVIRVNRRISPLEAGCLVESLTLWWGLRRRGVRAELRLGVRTLAGSLQSHAWVEYQGHPLNDAADIGQVFAPLDSGEIWSDLEFP